MNTAEEIYEGPILSSSAKNHYPMVIVKPEELADMRKIADTLKEGKTVLMNLERADLETSYRLIDFFRGFTYATGGSFERMSRNLLIITPYGISVSGELDQPLDDQENR